MRAFITSRPECCFALLSGLPKTSAECEGVLAKTNRKSTHRAYFDFLIDWFCKVLNGRAPDNFSQLPLV